MKEEDFWHRLGLVKGDLERQAILRDRFYKRREELLKKGIKDFEGPDVSAIYLEDILKQIGLGTKLLDVGCGSGHVLKNVAENSVGYIPAIRLVGLDLSKAMIRIAAHNTGHLSNVFFVLGDAYNLPFADSTFDVVLCRTSPYLPEEIYRILASRSHFVRYEQGPLDFQEIVEVFKERYTIRMPSWMHIETWKDDEIKRHLDVGFESVDLREFIVTQYYTKETLSEMIEMTPLVMDFSHEKDRDRLDEIAKNHLTPHGIAITRQYTILIGIKR